MSNVCVSVIMPSLNVRDYIEASIRSVMNQTLRDIEIICIDAGSTDGTLEIIEYLSNEDKRIKLIKSQIKSYGYQLNCAIKASNGEYIAVVETDDYIDERMYEELYTIAANKSIDIVKGNYTAYYTQKNGEKVFLRRDNLVDKSLYGDYSELTGLYWIWKNRIKQQDGKYYGLAHYRRFLELSEDDQRRLTANNIDAVLPYPMPYEPNIEAHHLRYLTDQEWNGVLQALKELEPEYAKAFPDILSQSYLYNYNIVLAKGKVLDDYCRWLFPLLFRIEEINNPNGDKEPNRYIGYVGETLETLYFMYNKDKLRIAHTGCRFLV